ncbi:MAG: DUF2341 domain-containing protein [Elusimicrobiota bacterium]
MYKKSLIMVILISGTILFLSDKAVAVYGNGSWIYRKLLPLTGSPGAGTNYQLKFVVGESSGTAGTNVNVDGHSLSAGIFDDVRFTDNDGDTELSYWRESVTGSSPDRSAIFWVKVKDNLDANQNIYIYYGNSSTTTTGNFDNVFTKDYGESGLAGLWHLDEGGGTTAVDSSGNNNTGTLTNGPVWQASDGGQWDSRSDVKFSTGSALSFNGSNYVNIPDAPSLDLGTGNFTFELWIKTTQDVSGEVSYLGRYAGSGDVSVHLEGDGPGKASFGARDSAGTWVNSGLSSTTINDNNWHYLVGVKEGNTAYIYVDGVMENSGSGTLTGDFNSSVSYRISGRSIAGFNAIGYIDETKIYTRALSAEEVYRHYIRSKYASPAPAAGTPGSEENLVWPVAISDLMAVPGTNDREIRLSWTAVADNYNNNIAAGKYRIKYSTDSSYSFNVNDYSIQLNTNAVTGQNQSHTLTGALGTTYYIRVWTTDWLLNWSAVSNSVSAIPYPVRRIVFTTSPVTVVAGNYSVSAITVQIQDENNNPLNMSEDTVLSLESSSVAGKFSLDKLIPLNEATIISGNNSLSFYYSDTAAGTATITVRNKTLDWWIEGIQIETVIHYEINHFAIECSTSGDAGIGRSVKLTAVDSYNNPISVYTGVANLSSDGNILLPASATFSLSDGGVKLIQALDYYVEKARITAEDSINPGIRGESSLIDWAGVKVVPVNIAPANVQQGDKDVGMEKLIIASSSGSGVLKGIKVKKAGTVGADSDVALVKLYRDNGDGIYNKITDILVSSAVFSLGTTILGGLNEQINEETKIYYLVYDFSLSAGNGNSVGVELTDVSYLDVAGRKVGMNNFPIASANSVIQGTTKIMGLKVESKLQTTIAQGSQDTVVERYEVWTDSGNVSWNKMGVSLTGSGKETDISLVKLYKKNSFGTITLAVDGGIQAVLVSSGKYSSGAAALNLTPAGVIDNTAQYYYLTYDVSNEATVGATVGASGNANNFDLGTIDRIDETNLPYSSGLGTLMATVDTMTISGIDLTSAQIKQGLGSKGRAFAKLNLKSLSNSVVLRSLKIRKKGTISAGEVSAVKVYKEDSSGVEYLDIGGGATVQVRLISGGADLFNNEEVTLSLTSGEVINTSGKNLYIGVELSEAASIGGTIGLKIEEGGVSVEAPDTAATGNLPFETKEMEIVDNPDQLTIAGEDLIGSGKSIVQGRETTVLKLDLSVDHDKTGLSRIRVKKLGNCGDGEVERIKVVVDNGDGSCDSNDRLISSGNDLFSSGEALVNIAPAEEVSNRKTIFIVIGMRSDAVVGNSLGAEVSDSSFIEVTIPDTVNNSGFPISSSIASIKDGRTPTAPLVVDDGLYTCSESRLHAYWTSQVYTGSIGESVYAIGTLSGSANVAGWTSVGSSLEIERRDLALINGATYFISVKVKNSLGDYWSDVGVSDGLTVDLVKPLFKEIPKITDIISRNALNDVVIKWPVADSGVSGIVRYEVQQREAKSPLWKTIKTVEMSAASLLSTAVSVDDSYLTYLVEGVLSGTYYYRVRAENGAGVWSEWSEMGSPTIVGELPEKVLSEVSNYPNPFDSRKTSTKINYTLNQKCQVKITIYDLLGYLVREVSVEGNPGGANSFDWDGTDNSGRKVSQGMYLAVIEAEGADGAKSKITHKIGVIH